MKIKQIVGVILSSTMTLFGLTFIIEKIQSVEDYLPRIEHAINELQQKNVQWDLDIILTKNSNRNYDSISNVVTSMEIPIEEIISISGELKSNKINSLIYNLRRSVRQKSSLIEFFKRQNSILRNSFQFLPTAIDELNKTVKDGSYYYFAPSTKNIQKITDSILIELLQYNVAMDNESYARVDDELEHLASLKNDPGIDNVIVEHINLIIRHGKMILVKKLSEQFYLNQISELKISEQINDISLNFKQLITRYNKTAHRWQLALVGYATILLFLLMFLGYRLYRTYDLLRQSNETLEYRVIERTKELSGALIQLRESQTLLVQSEKMASIGQMVAGIAHEVNTPLAYIKSTLETLASRSEDLIQLLNESVKFVALAYGENTSNNELEKQLENLDEISQAFIETDALPELRSLLIDSIHGIEQIADIVLNLKNFARVDRSNKDLFNINDGIVSTLKIARNMVKTQTVVTELGDIEPVLCSPTQINQVLLNLITNASQAIGKTAGAKILIRTAQEQRGVLVEVMDNGPGIAPEIRGKLFEPFTTTKKTGEGTGLGLSIVHKIIESHGGNIKVSSAVGKGTRFTFFIPSKQLEEETETQDESQIDTKD